jgi:hypothetical protein
MFGLRHVMVVLALISLLLVGCPAGPDTAAPDEVAAAAPAREGSGGPAPVENSAAAIEVPNELDKTVAPSETPTNEGADASALRRANAATAPPLEALAYQ